MTKRPGDETPDPEGGHAAERLREFRKARLPADEADQVLPGEERGDRQAEDSEAESGSGQPPDNP